MMTLEQRQKRTSVTAINKAMKKYRGDTYVEPPKAVVMSDMFDTLSRHQIDQGVIALVHACNLSGGSSGDMDLYRLARTYLWSNEAQAEINDIVRRYALA